MSVAWHIIRKDLVRLRWVLALWVVLLIAGLGMAVIQANLSYDEYLPFWIVASIMISGFLPLIAFGLVMGLMHDDPVAEIDAFWITRPISGGQLLAAKMLALLFLALIPVLVAIPFLLSYDYSWLLIGRAALVLGRDYFVLVALALPFAVVSANGSKFVMNVMLAAGGLLLLMLLLRLGSGEADRTASVLPGLVRSKGWLIVDFWLFATLIVTLNQFFRRRTRRSVAVLVAAAVVGLPIVKWWPWAFADPSVELFRAVAGDAPVFPAVINGAIRPARLVAEVPLRPKAGSVRAGSVLKIQSVFLDYTGELQVAFSEGAPLLYHGFGERLAGGTRSMPVPEYYFITNPGDGRMLPVTPAHQGNGLVAATLQFSHSSIRLRPAAAVWRGGPPPNLTAWLQDARLIKVVAADPAPLHP